MPVTAITSYEEFKAAISSDESAVIDFSATWCGPCKVISPIFANLSDVHAGLDGLKFYKVDIDEVKSAAEEVKIRAVPTFMLFRGGNKVGELLGANPKALRDFIAPPSTDLPHDDK